MGLVAHMMIDEYMMTFYHFAWLPILYITGLDKRKNIYQYVFLSRVQEKIQYHRYSINQIILTEAEVLIQIMFGCQIDLLPWAGLQPERNPGFDCYVIKIGELYLYVSCLYIYIYISRIYIFICISTVDVSLKFKANVCISVH